MDQKGNRHDRGDVAVLQDASPAVVSSVDFAGQRRFALYVRFWSQVATLTRSDGYPFHNNRCDGRTYIRVISGQLRFFYDGREQLGKPQHRPLRC